MKDTFLKIASFNIASTGYAGENGVENLNARFVENKIEAAGIQEVDKYNSRNNFDTVEKFTDCGYFPYGFFRKAIDFAGGEYGIAQLCLYEASEISGTELPWQAGEKRALQNIKFEKDGKKISFYNAHLSYESAEARGEQFKAIIDILDKDETPYKVLTGDFNVADRAEYEIFADKYRAVNGHGGEWIETFNRKIEGESEYCIDNIIYTPNMKLINFASDKCNLSDHDMLFAEFELL